MSVDKLKNKIGFQIGFLLHSNKEQSKVIYDLTQIAVDYHNENIELSNLQAIQNYLLERGSNDENINDKISQLKK